MGQASLFSPYKERVGFTFAIRVTIDSVFANLCKIVVKVKKTALILYEENKIETDLEDLYWSQNLMG